LQDCQKLEVATQKWRVIRLQCNMRISEFFQLSSNHWRSVQTLYGQQDIQQQDALRWIDSFERNLRKLSRHMYLKCSSVTWYSYTVLYCDRKTLINLWRQQEKDTIDKSLNRQNLIVQQTRLHFMTKTRHNILRHTLYLHKFKILNIWTAPKKADITDILWASSKSITFYRSDYIHEYTLYNEQRLIWSILQYAVKNTVKTSRLQDHKSYLKISISPKDKIHIKVKYSDNHKTVLRHRTFNNKKLN